MIFHSWGLDRREKEADEEITEKIRERGIRWGNWVKWISPAVSPFGSESRLRAEEKREKVERIPRIQIHPSPLGHVKFIPLCLEFQDLTLLESNYTHFFLMEMYENQKFLHMLEDFHASCTRFSKWIQGINYWGRRRSLASHPEQFLGTLPLITPKWVIIRGHKCSLISGFYVSVSTTTNPGSPFPLPIHPEGFFKGITL